MAIRYSTPKEVASARTAVEFDAVGVNIRVPARTSRTEQRPKKDPATGLDIPGEFETVTIDTSPPRTASIYVEMRDSAGNKVDQIPLHFEITGEAGDADFIAAQNAIKKWVAKKIRAKYGAGGTEG